jgi:hypothetical protein
MKTSCSQVLSCLVYTKRPLSREELSEAIDMFHTPSKTNMCEKYKVYHQKIAEQCAPLVRVAKVTKESTTQSLCSLYHTSVRRFLEKNPNVLQSEGPNSNKDLSISPRLLAYATLRYLQQPRYGDLLHQERNDHSHTFSTACGSDIMNHHLLIYSAKYWAKHVEDLHGTPYSGEICKEVDQFVRSKAFGTCLQVQSLFVQGQSPPRDRNVINNSLARHANKTLLL